MERIEYRQEKGGWRMGWKGERKWQNERKK